jgi:uncharacterized membrane protein YgcG
MAEQAALIAEALADVALATTIAMADADNSRQQTTINNRLGQAVSGGGSVRGSGGASSGLALWRGEVADRTMTKVEAAVATTATEEAVAEAAAAPQQQQQRCNGGGGGRRGSRGDGGNSSGGGDRGSGGNKGRVGNRGSCCDGGNR